jgi:hypothetical protein
VGGLVLRVLLPEGWAVRENLPPGRVFRAPAMGERPGGQLRVTVDEPLEVEPGESLDERLWIVLDEVAYSDRGQRFHEFTGDSTLGRMVTAAYHHPRFGIVQVWVAAGRKGTVMATYTMSLEDTVAQELIDAQGIVESADLTELDPAAPHSH